MGLRAGPGSPKQVESTLLLQRVHWIEVRTTIRARMLHGNFGVVGRTGVGVEVNIAADEQKEKNEETRKGEKAGKVPAEIGEKKSPCLIFSIKGII